MTSRGGSATVAEHPAPRPEIIESRLRPPQIPAGSVRRTALIDRLESRATPMVVLSAAPGYGKTTLLSQWHACSPRAFAWFSLDDQDNDPVVLLNGVATALHRLTPLDPTVFEALESAGASIEATVLPLLGASMAESSSPFVLALDDLHAVTNPSCLDAIDALIDHIPEGSRLVLSGRGEPSSRIAALRARGLVTEIGARELRMEQREARDLLRDAEVELSDAELARLVEVTEGWPAGLYLAAIAGAASMEEASAFGGKDRFVAEYLRSELLSRLRPAEVSFLTRTSVLGRMCGPLCDAVLESEHSAEMLESLRRSNRLVVALDRNREWYRYHHLLRDLLRAELERTEPELVPILLGRASEWCAANAAPRTAIEYAQDAGDVDHVAELVLLQARPEYDGGRVVTVDRWMEWLERIGGLSRNPMVTALGAWVSVLRGRSGDAERWAEIAEHSMREGASTADDVFVEAWLATLRAARCSHGPGRMRADAERAAKGFGRASPFWSTPAMLLGVAHLISDEDGPAEDLFEDAEESARAVESWNAVTLGLAERALLAVEREDLRQAEARTEEAEAVVRRARMEDYPTNAIVYAACARVAIHRGETARAGELLTRAQRLRPRVTHVLGAFAIQTRLELARAYVSLADAAGARTLLRETDALMRRGSGFGTLARQADDLRAKLDTMTAQTPGASTLTTAELRVLPLLTTHLSFREIGERLYLSRHTVKSHAMSIYRKLDVSSRGEAVECARDLGLL